MDIHGFPQQFYLAPGIAEVFLNARPHQVGGDIHQFPADLRPPQHHQVELVAVPRRLQCGKLPLRRVHIPVGGECQPPPVMPHRRCIGQPFRLRRFSQRFVPHPEPCKREHAHRQIGLNRPHLSGNRNGNPLPQPGRRRQRQAPLPFHHGRVPQEMEVVRIVGGRIEPLRVALGDVVLIGSGCPFVGDHCVVIAAQPQIDV